jgi:hypothetical protein
MIRFLGWCTVVAGLVAVGWFARGAALEGPPKAPVTVSVTVKSAEAPKPAVPVQSARRAAPKAATTSTAKAEPAKYGTTQTSEQGGIGYYALSVPQR